MQKIIKWLEKKQLRDTYPHATRWQVIKFNVSQFFRRLFQGVTVVGVLSAIVWISFSIGAASAPEHIKAEVGIFMDSKASQKTLEQKMNELQTEIVDTIAKNESSNSSTEDALIIFDDNKKGTLSRKDKVSIGCMQFKVSTVQLYSKQLRNQTLSNYDAVLLALDCAKAKALAKEVIFKVDGGLWNWSVATKEMGDKVGFIKELAK